MSKNQPKMRFPKFNDDWQSIQLNSLLEFKNGINANGDMYGSGIKFINVLDILNNDFITYEKIIGRVNVDDRSVENNRVDYGDILFQRSSETREEVGTANVYLDTKPAIFGGFVIRGKKIGDYHPPFLNYLLKTPLARVEIMSKSGGSTRYNLSQSTLSDVSVIMPEMNEQVKIANFFMTIDSRISIQSSKLTSLQELKKGVIQKIFSQEIRFKREDGTEYPEWKSLFLSELVTKRFKGELPKQKEDGNILLNNEYLENDSTPLRVSNNINVTHEDILILWDGSQAGKVYTGFAGVLGSTLVGITLNHSRADNRFIYFYLGYNLETIQRSWRTGSGVPHVTKEFIEKFKVPVPSVEEQQKIADFLSTLDSKIDLESQILSTLQTLKKGLLKKMFI